MKQDCKRKSSSELWRSAHQIDSNGMNQRRCRIDNGNWFERATRRTVGHNNKIKTKFHHRSAQKIHILHLAIEMTHTKLTNREKHFAIFQISCSRQSFELFGKRCEECTRSGGNALKLTINIIDQTQMFFNKYEVLIFSCLIFFSFFFKHTPYVYVHFKRAHFVDFTAYPKKYDAIFWAAIIVYIWSNLEVLGQ